MPYKCRQELHSAVTFTLHVVKGDQGPHKTYHPLHQHKERCWLSHSPGSSSPACGCTLVEDGRRILSFASAPQLMHLTAPGLLHCIQFSSWHSNALYLMVTSLLLQGVRVSEMQTPLVSFSSEKIYFPFPQLTTAYLNSLESSENFEKQTLKEFC